MGNFVTDESSNFSFGFSSEECSGVNENFTTGEGEGVDRGILDDIELIFEFVSTHESSDVFADFVDVAVDNGIFDQ